MRFKSGHCCFVEMCLLCGVGIGWCCGLRNEEGLLLVYNLKLGVLWYVYGCIWDFDLGIMLLFDTLRIFVLSCICLILYDDD